MIVAQLSVGYNILNPNLLVLEMTKLADFATQLAIDTSKLTKYALNPKSDKGRHKARVFKAVLGYTQTNYQSLLAQIQAQSLTAQAKIIRTDKFGSHLQVDLEIVGPHGKSALVRTGWLVEPNSDIAQLTTLYVKEEIG